MMQKKVFTGTWHLWVLMFLIVGIGLSGPVFFFNEGHAPQRGFVKDSKTGFVAFNEFGGCLFEKKTLGAAPRFDYNSTDFNR